MIYLIQIQPNVWTGNSGYCFQNFGSLPVFESFWALILTSALLTLAQEELSMGITPKFLMQNTVRANFANIYWQSLN